MQQLINYAGQKVTITLTQFELKKISEALHITNVKELTKLISAIIENEIVHKPREQAHKTIRSLQYDLENPNWN